MLTNGLISDEQKEEKKGSEEANGGMRQMKCKSTTGPFCFFLMIDNFYDWLYVTGYYQILCHYQHMTHFLHLSTNSLSHSFTSSTPLKPNDCKFSNFRSECTDHKKAYRVIWTALAKYFVPKVWWLTGLHNYSPTLSLIFWNNRNQWLCFVRWQKHTKHSKLAIILKWNHLSSEVCKRREWYTHACRHVCVRADVCVHSCVRVCVHAHACVYVCETEREKDKERAKGNACA